MRNAQNNLSVDFHEAMEILQGICRHDIVLRFRYRNADGKEVSIKSIRATALFADWYGECNVCPANDTLINHLHILLNPSCTALNVTHDVKFELLMDTLENLTRGRKHCA